MSPSRSSWPLASTALLDLGRRDVVAALVLADVDAERVAAERVERHLGDRDAVRVVVAERVDVGRGVVRGDDDLGVERRPPRGCVRVTGCAGGSASAGRTGAAATPATAAGRGRSLVWPSHDSFPARSLHTWTMRGTTAATIRSPSSLLARVASPTTPDSRDVAEHVHRHDHAGPLRAHLVAAERRPRQSRLAHRLAAVPGVARRAVGLDPLAERHRQRGLRLLGVDQRPLDLGEHVAGEVPPLREEDAPARWSRSSG